MENVLGFPNPNDDSNGENQVDEDADGGAPTSVIVIGKIGQTCRRYICLYQMQEHLFGTDHALC